MVVTRIRTPNATMITSGEMRLHVNCACAIGTSLNLDLLCVAENGVVIELRRTAASQICHSCRFADKRGERGYYDESDVVLCVN